MTRDEALTIIAHKAAAWPASVIDDAAATVWLEHLGALEARPALEAMRHLEATVTSPFGPTIAELRIQYDAEVARRPALRGPRDERECGYCEGNRWTEHTGGAIPCPRCNGVLHERWASGELRPKFADRTWHDRAEPATVARHLAEARLAMAQPRSRP